MIGITLSKEAILKYASIIDGHYDNTASAVFGGLNIIVANGPELPRRISFPWPDELGLMVWIPDYELLTETARAVLPSSYERASVVCTVENSQL
jgi:homoserine kinase